jgi:DNA topoisomerase I
MQALAPLVRDATAAARAARLRYASSGERGWTRKRRGASFRYFDEQGRRVVDEEALARIRSLAIPPAWTEVWISPKPHSHIQATGRDAKGRKQYKYHPRFRELRDAAKFAHIIRFGEKLPDLRRRVRRHLDQRGLEREKVLSAIVELMQRTCVRVGNDQYAATNGSYGLTTLEDRHALIRGAALRFKFKGKSGKVHEVTLNDAKLARIVQRCRDAPGQRLFQYQAPDGKYRAITSSDVNDYLREVTGEPFSAKDFRTWAGTLLAVHALAACEPCTSATAARRQVKQALSLVSAELGNTVAICRKSYVHPAVVTQYTGGELRAAFEKAKTDARRRPVRGLRAPEAVTLCWLKALPPLVPVALE